MPSCPPPGPVRRLLPVVAAVVVAIAAPAACGSAAETSSADGTVVVGEPTTAVDDGTASTQTSGPGLLSVPAVASSPTGRAVPTTAAPGSTSAAPTSPPGSTSAAPTSRPTPAGGAGPIEIALRLDRRVDDETTAGFAALVRQVLTDPRGWSRAGFVFTFDTLEAPYTVVLAEGDEVDRLCLPYDTYGRFSCQIGPVVALNADRWRTAVPNWPGTLEEYRTMLVNHEVGHLIGQHHPAERCPVEGAASPVMAQQSSGVEPCLANPWPLDWEVDCARLGLEPLAPPFERNIVLTCGPDGPE